MSSPAQRRRAHEFAALLEQGRSPADHELEHLVALVTTLRPAPLAPEAGFRADLRARLVAEAAARPATGGVPRQRAPKKTRPHRIRQVVATATAVALIGGTGAAMASTRALPGDALYPLKRGLESVEVALARSDLDRGRELLERAGDRLTEAERLAASEDAREPVTREQISTVLAEMTGDVRAGSEALTDSYRDTGDPEPLFVLDQFVVDQHERLADLLDLLDPRLRDDAQAVTELLEALHAQVTAVTGDARTTSTSATRDGVRSEQAAVDGWAVSRLGDRVTQLTGADAGDTGPDGKSDGGGGLLEPAGDSGGGVLEDTGDTLRGVTGSLTGGSGSAKTGSRGLPLPTSSPIVSDNPLPGGEVSASVGPLPPVKVTAPCVAVPPLTSC